MAELEVASYKLPGGSEYWMMGSEFNRAGGVGFEPAPVINNPEPGNL